MRRTPCSHPGSPALTPIRAAPGGEGTCSLAPGLLWPQKRDGAAWPQSLTAPGDPLEMRLRSHLAGGHLPCCTGGCVPHCEPPPRPCPPPSWVHGYSQGPQGAQLAEGVGSHLPDAVVLEAARAARQAGDRGRGRGGGGGADPGCTPG